MQEDWKQEIEEVLHGLRMKEKVRVSSMWQRADSNRCRYVTHHRHYVLQISFPTSILLIQLK